MTQRRIDRYAVLASAIACRRLTVETTETDSTHTDGRTIYIAGVTDDADVGDAVVVQAALLAAGSLQRDRMSRLSRHRCTVAERYLAFELGRITAQLDRLLPARAIARIKTLGITSISSSSDESVRRALGREPIPSLPGWVGTVKPSRLRRVDESDLRAAPTDQDLQHLGQLEERAPQPEDSPDDDAEESRIINLLSAPGMSNPLGEALQKLLGMGRSGLDKNQGGVELSVARQRFGSVGRHARRSRVGEMVTALFDTAPVAGIRYPEWNCHKGVYRPDWCIVTEYDPAETNSEPDNPTNGSFLQPLARVGIEPERHRRQADGDSLDLSALVDYESDRRRGDHPDPNIYESSRLTKRDLSVLVLLDCSGSTAEESSGHVVFEEERRLAGDLTSGLERLGDRVGTYGFYSRGKDAVKFLRIKEFGARFDGAAKRRLGWVQPSGFTRTGAAIRHSAHVLEAQALAKNMILLVIGDGLPYDDGYEDRYARADARHAIDETMRRGIGVVGIGIRSSTEPEVLEDVWSAASFRVIAESGEVRRHLRGLLLNALAVTRSNGRRREVVTEEHHTHLRSLHATRHGKLNSYV